ncbi:MAG: response regulator [Acidobacteriota bacterium]
MASVLIVEDNFSTRHSIVSLLEKSGYSVFAAENGEEALGLMQYETPDLIISDIMMPGMDGLELFKRINDGEMNDHVPFIFLTGKTDISDQREGMLSGADDYITKPFKAMDLLKSVETRLKKKEKLDRKIEHFKSNITRNISHEFRTPLVPIIGYSQMIKENYWQLEPSEILEMTEKINSSGTWMLKMIEKFLLLVELEENINVKEEGFASISASLSSSISGLASASERKKDLIVNLSEALVRIPEAQMERMITEILDNALRFSNSGSPVEIVSYSKGDYHILTITDFGKGMTQDQLRYISSFLQFSRQGMHRAGLGLGISIVKKIAEHNGAGVIIESELGMFTKVCLKLPLIKNETPAHNQTKESLSGD